MAGDWIKMRSDLWTCPHVVRIVSACDAGKSGTIGALFRLWCLADAHTEDGFLAGYTTDMIDCEVGITGFSGGCEDVGWLHVSPEGITVPRFEEHNGKSAKRRAQEATRKRTVRKVSASDADKKRTREEKRREEKSKKVPLIFPFDSFTYPAGTDTPEVRQAIADWLEYRQKSGKPYKMPSKQIGGLLKKYPTAHEFVAAVDNSIAQGYQGCHPPNGGRDGNHTGPQGTSQLRGTGRGVLNESPARIH